MKKNAVDHSVRQWAVANLSVTRGWPKEKQTIDFDGRSFSLIPVVADGSGEGFRYPAVVMQLEPKESYEYGWSRIARFLSVLAWASDGWIGVFQFGGSASRPSPVAGLERNSQSVIQFYIGGFPSGSLRHMDEKWMFPLAVWREGNVIADFSVRYAFLAFWRIWEAAVPNAKRREEAFENGFPNLIISREYDDGHGAAGMAWVRYDCQNLSISDYLWKRGRNVIAHSKEPTDRSNPDDIEEEDRIRKTLPLMKAVAKYALLNLHKVPPPRQMWR